jgi:hypothetical protein
MISCIFVAAKVRNSIKLFFQKPLAQKKKLRIFARGFGIEHSVSSDEIFNKDFKDTKQ